MGYCGSKDIETLKTTALDQIAIPMYKEKVIPTNIQVQICKFIISGITSILVDMVLLVIKLEVLLVN